MQYHRTIKRGQGVTRLIGLCGVIALAVGFGYEIALGAEPAAIVMSVTGTADPQLPPHALVDEGVRVSLGLDGRLTFVVFGECGLFTASGGTVTFQRHEAKVEGGTLDRGVGPCTRAHTMAKEQEPAVGAGLALRGLGDVLRVSARPQFVLAGPGAGRVIGARLVPDGKDGSNPVPMVLNDGILRVSEDTPALPTTRYKLALEVSSGEQPTELAIAISSETTENSLDVLIVK